MTLHSRATVVALVAAGFVLAACATDQEAASESSSSGCYGPWLDDDALGEPPDPSVDKPAATVSPGATLTLYGHGYTTTCDDTGGSGQQQPLRPLHLTVTLPTGERVRLGEFTPRVENADVGFVVRVTVPIGTPAGTAVVFDDRTHPTRYQFTVS